MKATVSMDIHDRGETQTKIDDNIMDLCRSRHTSLLFPFCHPEIARILAGPGDRLRNQQHTRTASKSSSNSNNNTVLSLERVWKKFETDCVQSQHQEDEEQQQQQQQQEEEEDEQNLIELALICDDLLFSRNKLAVVYDADTTITIQNMDSLDSTHSLFLNALIQEVRVGTEMSKEGTDFNNSGGEASIQTTTTRTVTTTVATLLALNLLESTLRQIMVVSSESSTRQTKQKLKGSPLLKDMVASLSTLLLKLNDNNNTDKDDTEDTHETAAAAATGAGGSRPSNKYYLYNVCRLLLLPRRYDDDGDVRSNNNNTNDNNNNGLLNFRNLVWHGFVPNVPRPWFSLVVVMIRELQSVLDVMKSTATTTMKEITNTKTPAGHTVFDLREYPEYESLLLLSKDTSVSNTTLDKKKSKRYLSEESTKRIENWLHSTTSSGGSTQYIPLWNLVERFLDQRESQPRPATICAILSVLMEHALRQDWCKANDRPEDIQARNDAFYVTLDGHGQRNLHDLILHPFLTNGTRNLFLPSTNNDDAKACGGRSVRDNMFTLDGPTLALLTDLFYSPTGPNIRATVSHGMWDSYLEMERCKDGHFTLEEQRRLWDMVHIMLIAMDQVALTRQHQRSSSLPSENSHAPLPDDFRPVFSYLEETRRQFQDAHRAVQSLGNICNGSSESTSFETHFTEATMTMHMSAGEKEIVNQLQSIANLSVEKEILPNVTSLCDNTKRPPYDVYSEFHFNQRLQSLGATRLLLKEVADAARSQVDRLEGAVLFWGKEEDDKYTSRTLMKRKQKTALRVLRSSELVQSLYVFCLWVATQSLHQGVNDGTGEDAVVDAKTLQGAIRRTRMVVSTVDTFLDTNMDRAVKAMADYTKSKVIQKVIECLGGLQNPADQSSYEEWCFRVLM